MEVWGLSERVVGVVLEGLSLWVGVMVSRFGGFGR